MYSRTDFAQRMIRMSLLILSAASIPSCKDMPKVELCAYHAESRGLICNDPRRDSEDYTRVLINGDLVTAPESFERVKAYCAEKVTALKKCKRRVRR